MIVLDAVNEKVQGVLGSAIIDTDPEFFASYRDINTGASPPTYVAGNSRGSFSGVTDADIVTAPGTNTQRVIDFISIYNSGSSTKTVIVKLDIAGAETVLWRGVLAQFDKAIYCEGAGWFRIDPSGGVVQSYASSPTDVQTVFGGSGTTGVGVWTKPTAFTPKFVKVICFGGGGSGGGGASQTGAVVRSGGCGGGGGARAEYTYLASDLGATEDMIAGLGALGGNGGASGADGIVGSAGGNSWFSAGTKQLFAYGGGGGALGDNAASAGAGGAGGGLSAAGGTGTTSAATGGGPGAPATPNGGCGANSLATAGSPVCAEYGGGAGGGHTNVVANGLGGSSLFGGAGGGCGAGTTAVPALINATAGGQHIVTAGGGGAAGTSGAAPTAGTAGGTGNSIRGGWGGGGGGGTITANTAGGAGGSGGLPGGGGGGGGAGCNTGVGGRGGDGGGGAVYVFSW